MHYQFSQDTLYLGFATNMNRADKDSEIIITLLVSVAKLYIIAIATFIYTHTLIYTHNSSIRIREG